MTLRSIVRLFRDRHGATISASILAILFCTATYGCRQEPESAAASSRDAPTVRDEVSDPGADDIAADLLSLAYDAADRLPADHVKTRTRLQQSIVDACLELGRLELAERFGRGIENWRRGAALADLAFHRARAGESDAARRLIDEATKVARQAARGGEEQKWRIDRVRARIARVLFELGDVGAGLDMERGLEPSELAPIVTWRAEAIDEAVLDDRLEELEAVFTARDFEQVRTGLAACTKLYSRFYREGDRRSRIEELVQHGLSTMPPDLGLTVFAELAEAAIYHKDLIKALELIADANRELGGHRWEARSEIPMRARLAELTWRAGAHDAARTDANTAYDRYLTARDEIVDIWRAGTLRPLAATFHLMGEVDRAKELFALAVNEGMENPNSVPRTEDLCGACVSMVLNGFQPGASLRGRLTKISAELGDPW